MDLPLAEIVQGIVADIFRKEPSEVIEYILNRWSFTPPLDFLVSQAIPSC